MFPAIALLTFIPALVGQAAAQESHKVTFTNNCGHGTPMLVKGEDVLSEGGGEYVSNGALESAIVYLNNGANGECSHDGNQCSMVEITLLNGEDGKSSQADISLIDEHTFSDPIGFEYTDGCSGLGAYCGESGCNTAYYVSNDDCVLVGCAADNAGINIIFCNVQTGFTEAGHQTSPCHGNSTSSAGASSGTTSGQVTTASDTTAPASDSTDSTSVPSTTATTTTTTT
ncbi:hypothetical protein A7U60_g2430 [Sanghuangporus baumii]|uniref:Glycopeptide n=1 Tax=Sanghuangporus baumii TaxID=108892 RepID=A0A9Q5NAX1_SANBA|nr:hypothetical protein A7U60_g2430 [Sanghuangporus baumii]